MIILGIESTCDETAAALVEDGRHLLSNVISTSVKEQALYGGVVPEIASRKHIEAIYGLAEQALEFFNLLHGGSKFRGRNNLFSGGDSSKTSFLVLLTPEK